MFLSANKFFNKSLVFGALALTLPFGSLFATEFNMDVRDNAAPCYYGKGSSHKRDHGQSLAFGFEIVTTATDINTIATPYVVRPDGKLIAGAPFMITAAGTFSLQSLSICNPLFGTYNVGVQTNAGTPSLLTVNLLASVQASRAGGSTTYVINEILGLGLSILNAQTQTSANFAYGRNITGIP